MLAQLQKALAAQGRAALSGLGGIGKTQTAMEYAHRYLDEYVYTFWVSAASRGTILSTKRRDAYFGDMEKYGYLYQNLPKHPPVDDKHIKVCQEIYDSVTAAPLPLVVLAPSPTIWVPSVLRNLGVVSTSIPKGSTRRVLGKSSWSNQEWTKSDAERRALDMFIDEQEGNRQLSGSVLLSISIGVLRQTTPF